jgi:uncharacterized DUF497 family protein
LIVRIYELIVEPGREEHIARHQVQVAEVEEVVFGVPIVHRTRQDRYRLIGQTHAGRYLTIFVAPRGRGVYGLITAREATDAERRVYHGNRRS